MVMPNIGQAIGYMSANKADGLNQKGKQAAGGFDLMLANLKAPITGFGNGLNKFTDNIKRADNTQPQDNAAAKADRKATAEAKSEAVTGSVKAETTVTSNADSTEAAYAVRKNGASVADDELPDNELIERISALLSLVSELIMDKLELNLEEFNKLLEEMNMTAVDLLDPERMQMLVLAANNEDSLLALLTNEKLSALMKELNSQVGALKDEAAIPQDLNADELKELLAATELSSKDGAANAKDNTFDSDELLNTDNSDIINESTNESRFADDRRSMTTENARNDVSGDLADDTEAVQSSKSTANTAADKQSQESDVSEQNPFQSFVDRLVNSAAGSAAVTDENLAAVSNLRDIAYQIIDKIRVSITADQTSLQINLNPEHLGRVNLTIQASEGVMTARFVVESQISKEAIESQLNVLKETLNEQGVKVDAIEVSVAAYAFDQNSDNSQQNRSETGKQNSGRHLSIDEAMSMTEEDSFEDRFAANNATSDNQINYVA